MGSVIVSLDVELGWGFHDVATPPPDRVESARRGWATMVDLLAEFDVPATWAVVGHLMLDACDGEHADHPVPDGWFERERTTWRDRPDLRFGPDLVEAVLESPVDHELGCHSFSHALFGDPATSRELATAELERCREIALEWDHSLDSFVYPRNDVDHRDVLAEQAFSAYRGRATAPQGVRGALEAAAGGRSLLVEPALDEYGLVNVPASAFLFAFEGRLRTVAESIWEDPMVALARRGIDEAATGEGVFHVWLHPNNLTEPRDETRLREILRYLDRRRSETALTVETMGEVADRVRSSVRPASASASIHGRHRGY